MSVQFIIGRAGSGKTHYCLEAIREALRLSQRGPALILLVPEQATYQTERALATTPGLGGYCRAFVLSFRRLAYHVLLEAGGTALPPLEATGRQMALRAIVRKRGPDLRLFEKSARQRGFVERLGKTLSELRSYGHGADRLALELARLEERGAGDSLLAAKLHDLAIVAREYEEFLATRYVDPDAYLDLLTARLPEKNTFHGARLWVDGFASLTGQEERALAALMRVASDTKIALCLEGEAGSERGERAEKGEEGDCSVRNPKSKIQNPKSEPSLSMFALLRETYERLSDLARTDGHLILPPAILPVPNQPTRFAASPALARIEQRLFGGTTRSPAPLLENGSDGSTSKTQHSIILSTAADQRCEVRDAASEILRLCREEGYRFREIAVILRDVAPYGALIEAVFNDHEIPHFLDVRRDVAHHPLVELIRAALAVVARRWPSQEVIRYAKTDLAPIGLEAGVPCYRREAVDRLENFVLEHGVEGDAWYGAEPWRFRHRQEIDEDGRGRDETALLREINGWREAIVGPLRRFEQETRKDDATVLEYSRALWDLLDEMQVARRLEQWAREAESAGRLTEADEHRQVWDAVVDLLDQAVAALGGLGQAGQQEPITLEEYRDLIEAGLESIRLRLVPPALDQVLVGSVERSRHPEIRAAFVMGMNERVFPQPQMPDVVFGDRERDQLAGDGLQLGPVSEKRLLHEQFLAYIAFTRPSERLYVSWAKADAMGKVLHPSPYIDAIRKILGSDSGIRNPQSAIRSPQSAIASIGHWRAALSGLAAGLRGDAPAATEERGLWMALYGEMRRDGGLCDALARRVGGLAYENQASLKRPLAQRLYGGRNESSVSRLETFAACPFKHFARYGLELEERLQFRIESFDLGLLYHAVLRDVFERLSGGKPLDWGQVAPEQAVVAVEDAITRLAPRLRDEIFLSSARNRYLLASARGALTTFIRVLIAASQRDGFSQAAAEVAFGREKGSRYGPIEVVLNEDQRLLVRGRIDRIDVGTGNHSVIRLVDYKSRAREFRLNELAHGLALQLPTYLLAAARGAAARGKSPVVAGALYVPLLRSVKLTSPAEVLRVTAEEPSAAENEGAALQSWKARGFFEFRWAALFDAEVGAHAGRSPIVSLNVKQNGEPFVWNAHDALPDGALGELLGWTECKLREFGQRIVTGEVAVAPYQLANVRPCTVCEFGAFCRFDGRHEPYRMLQMRKRVEALDWMREQLSQ